MPLLKVLYQHLDQRLGLSPLLKALRQSRPANYLSPLDAPPISPGHFVLLLVAALILSGLGLTFFYSPTAERAASSLAYLHLEQPLGWLIHNVHRWSALLIVILVILHALRVWLTRAYRYPRDLNWWLGLCLLLVVFVMGGTGYLLRWDVKAFTLMDLVISNLSNVPVLGAFFIAVLLGGSEMDVVPLYRGYALHVWFLYTGGMLYMCGSCRWCCLSWLRSTCLLSGSKGLWRYQRPGGAGKRCFPGVAGSTCCPA